MTIYFVTWLTDITLGKSLTKKKACTRLVSYHFLKEKKITSNQLAKYSQNGRVDVRKKKNI